MYSIFKEVIKLKITYDPEVDAAYIRFVEGPIQVTTHRLSEDIALNYGPDGEVVGIEILSAREYLKFSNHIPEIQLENLKPVSLWMSSCYIITAERSISNWGKTQPLSCILDKYQPEHGNESEPATRNSK